MSFDARTAAVLVAAVAVLVATVLAAAVGGSWELEERDFGGGATSVPAETRMPEGEPDPIEVAPPPAGIPVDWSWLSVVGWVLVVVLAAFGVWWTWVWLRQRAVPRRQSMSDVSATTTMVEEPDLPVLRRGVAEAQRFLHDISGPTDAVIAAWLALEDAATASGVHRSPSQTPTEFTVAVLEKTNADPDATTELLSLYHLARFSGHPIGADDVTRASRCFGRLAASWDALAASDRGTS